MTITRILAISGSLKKTSTNTGYLHALQEMAPDEVEVILYDGLDSLPFFSPDRDGTDQWTAVEDFRTQLREADGVIVCTPEYAGGVPGVLKNALDWIVSSGEWMQKPTAIISASPSMMGGDKAHASLVLTLTMMEAQVVEGGSFTIPLSTAKINAQKEITDPATSKNLTSLWRGLMDAVARKKGGEA